MAKRKNERRKGNGEKDSEKDENGKKWSWVMQGAHRASLQIVPSDRA
jgi:hypothetical protein